MIQIFTLNFPSNTPQHTALQHTATPCSAPQHRNGSGGEEAHVHLTSGTPQNARLASGTRA